MNLSQWTERIDGLNLHDMELGLSRMRRVWERLSTGRLATTVFSVAGTNGKGTCAHFLERAFRAQGSRTGLYTSPHLLRFNERVRLHGRPVDDDTLCAAFEQVEMARQSETLTFFEFTTLAALRIFADAELDVVVLEVGLGGRLDAVNVVDADVAIVTRIGIDHTQYLGDTRAAIAREKAGIFRSGRPAIVADPEPPPTLAQYAQEVEATLFQRGDHFRCGAISDTEFEWACDARTLSALPRPFGMPLTSFAAALMALHCVDALPDAVTLRPLLRDWQLEGRLQWQPGAPNVLLDVAHNPQAAALLARRLAAIEGPKRVIVGMLADKDAGAFAKALMANADHWHAVGVDGPRGQPAQALAEQLAAAGVTNVCVSESVAGALAIERARAGARDTLVVCGSFHVVGPALAWLGLYSRCKIVKN
ncbi:MAG: bifunctional tetrahydrofolate synthase/dihydrofolate synthase [Gammaproteobacteria bacterium]